MVETFGPADIIITVHVVTRNCQDFTVNSEANASELLKILVFPNVIWRVIIQSMKWNHGCVSRTTIRHDDFEAHLFRISRKST